MRVSSSSSLSSSVSVGDGTAVESKVRIGVPVPRQLTAEQIAGIQEAFRKAGIEFEAMEVRPGMYTFGFSFRSREL